MITEVSIIIKSEEEGNQKLIDSKIRRALNEKGFFLRPDEFSASCIKKSIDARHGKIKFCLKYRIVTNGAATDDEESSLPVWKKADGKHSVIIVGLGPAGLFGALRLLEAGIKPVIIERGVRTIDRKKDIAAISTKGILDENSNYCFGEGGAGTFSDGKLYTRSNKRGNIAKILKIFVEFGANENILTDAHPHIGTDRLPHIINAMRDKILELGGEIHFCSKCIGFETETPGTETGIRVTGVRVQNTKDGTESVLHADAVMLATGHSANDIYELIAKTEPDALEAKTFAVGVRVEHPRSLIDAIQFHGEKMNQAAEYRLTAQVDGRGVYSFCMCPGGFVVPSATGPDQIVVNGMSSAARNSQWSNAAIVVETRPEDIPADYVKMAEKEGCPALAGLLWRSTVEKETALQGKVQAAPAQRLTDFLDGKLSETLPRSSYTPGLVSSRLDQWLPEHVSSRLKEAFREYDKNMKGFISEDALLIASETRTSTPVRINRDKETCECTALKGLYPAGEGSGYSGGIVSSAMDGEKCAAAIVKKLN